LPFIRGSWPAEVAPPIDYDTQFKKVYTLTIINKFVVAVGMKPFDKKISYRVSLMSR